MKNIYKITLAFSLLTIVSCKESVKENTTIKEEVIQVKVDTIKPNATPSFTATSGKIVAVNSANISTRIMGYVKKVHVKTGDKVVKGQLLIEVNDSDLQAKKQQVKSRIIQANTTFINSKKDYQRYQQLFKENSASQKELDNITSQFEISKANVSAAKEMFNEVESQIKYFKITAPFNGVVVNKFIEEGNMTTPGVVLISIEDVSKTKVETMVTENQITTIKKGAEVIVSVGAIDEVFKGKVAEISTSSINTGGQFLVTVLLNKSNSKVLSGMFSTVRFYANKKGIQNTVMIPEKAIIKRGQLSGIYTISNSNTAILRWLRLGKKQGKNIEVLSGLTQGETYITSSEGKLFNGAKVSIQ
jgi:RND family efflux transporter MFP subunit